MKAKMKANKRTETNVLTSGEEFKVGGCQNPLCLSERVTIHRSGVPFNRRTREGGITWTVRDSEGEDLDRGQSFVVLRVFWNTLDTEDDTTRETYQARLTANGKAWKAEVDKRRNG